MTRGPVEDLSGIDRVLVVGYRIPVAGEFNEAGSHAPARKLTPPCSKARTLGCRLPAWRRKIKSWFKDDIFSRTVGLLLRGMILLSVVLCARGF